MMLGGDSQQLAAPGGHQILIGGAGAFTRREGRGDDVIGQAGAADQLHHDVVVRVFHQVAPVAGELCVFQTQLVQDSLSPLQVLFRQPFYFDGQGAGGDDVGVFRQDADGAAADGAGAHDAYVDKVSVKRHCFALSLL